MRRSEFAKGVLSALLGALAWGFSGACFQFLFSSYQVNPLLLTCIRMLGAGLMFMATLLVRDPDKLRGIAADTISFLPLVIFGVVGLFTNQMLYTTTITYTNAGTATVLQTLNAVFVLGWACFAEKRRATRLELAALICALVGTYLIATGGNPSTLALPPEGLFFGLSCAVAAAFYITYPQKLFARWGSFAVTGIGMLLGGIAALICLLVSGGLVWPAFDAGGVVALLVITFIGSFGAYALYLFGVSVVGSVNGSMIGAAEPVSAALFASLWLGTAFSATDWISLVLMVATVVLIAQASK